MYLFYFAGAAVLAFLGLQDMKSKKVNTPAATPKETVVAVTPIASVVAPVATKKDDGTN